MEGARPIESDVCVIGAGIVGLAHAFEARARGLSVTVLERGARAVGASVRNFGHVIVSAMAAGPPLEVALDARERWLELGRRAGLEVHEAGTLVVARAADELELLAQVAAEPARGARLIGPAEVGALAPVALEGVLGGLHAELDLRVDPRRAVAALAALLERDPAARVLWETPVHDVAPGLAAGRDIEVQAPLIVVCPGPDHDLLPPALALERPELTRCKLQMLRVRAPGGRAYAPALLTGLSLLRYPGYGGGHPAAARLRERLTAEHPELVAAGIHLIVTQLPGGDLLIGDTHEYGPTPSPFNAEHLDELVLGQARRLLGVPALEVVERWHGIYPSAPGDPFLIAQPLPGVAVVEVVAGIGMTTALGLAPRTFAALTQPASAAA